MTDKELLTKALKALDVAQSLLKKSSHHATILAAYTKLRAQLEKTNDEPVAIYYNHRNTPNGTKEFLGMAENTLPKGTKLYAAPQSAATKDWVCLTDAEINKAAVGKVDGNKLMQKEFARAIESKLKEINT